jgi:tRNA (cytidine/uridine-2'-O-)-methyltransferase
MDDRTLRRAGLDYWQEVSLERHIDLDDLYAKHPQGRFFYFTTKAAGIYSAVNYQEGDFLVFGPETRGLPASVLAANADKCYRIPMPNPRVRSLNLATSVGIVLYEALRQNGFAAKRQFELTEPCSGDLR